MSEEKDKPEDDTSISAAAESSAEVTDTAPEPDKKAEVAAKADKPASATPAPAPVKGRSSFVGWLALLLVLVLAGAAGWSLQQGMDREKDLKRRINKLENKTGGQQAELQGQLQSLEQDIRKQLKTGLDAANSASTNQSASLQQFSQQLDAQNQQIAAFSANDHESWLRAEAQYLLRLANQRVVMARDADSALALLDSADSILRQLDDVSLHDVRAAVAAEQAALRAVPKVDVEGIYLRLSALVEQADRLVIFQMQEQEDQPEARPEEGDWQVRLERGYEEAARKLSDYIVIRRRDVPMQALMDPQWEGLVRQNLRMLLEQAQVALLSGNQTLYVESLQRSQHWVAQFFDTDDAAARAMSREIAQLEGQTIQVVMPNLTRSLQALDDAVSQRLQQGGAE
ncbi:MAG: uroporphyrinogen III [Halieaceae bacterium]|nr:uroporphyrinogen III [Halieaceae bacterium]